jgi:glycosyltransferase involved in cell wall biosynthesis
LALSGHEIVVFSGKPSNAVDKVTEWVFPRLTVHRLLCPDRLNFHRVAVPALAAEHRRQPFDAAEVPDLYAEGMGLREAIPNLPILLRCHTPLYIPREIDFNALPPFGRFLSALRACVGAVRHPRSLLQIVPTVRSRLRHRYDAQSDAERQVALNADLVVSPSRRLASRLREDWMIPGDKLVVLANPHIPDTSLLSLPPSSKAEVISFHGSIRYFKGVHILFDAMAPLMAARPALRLLLAGSVGDSPVPDISWTAWIKNRLVNWRDTLEWLQPRLAPWWSRVEYAGFIPPEQLSAHLARADICVFPSLFDNFPGACLEAMSAGRAIVATRSGGMEEMLGDDEAGLLVPPGNAKALAAAITRLLDDAELGALPIMPVHDSTRFVNPA